MKLFSAPSVLVAALSIGLWGCGTSVPAPVDGDPVPSVELPVEEPGDDDPATMPPGDEEPPAEEPPTEEEPPVGEPPMFVGDWTGVELIKSFNGNVYFNYPATHDEMTLTMSIASDMSVVYFLDIASSDTSMTGTAAAGATESDLTLALAGQVTYNSGNTADNLGDFTCTVDVDTMTCTGANDEEGDYLPADMVFERM